MAQMEDYTAADERRSSVPARPRTIRDLRRTVCLALRLRAPGRRGNPERRSITELEYRQAERSGLRKLALLAHQDTLGSWPDRFSDDVTCRRSRRTSCGDSAMRSYTETTASFFRTPGNWPPWCSRQSCGVARAAALQHPAPPDRIRAETGPRPTDRRGPRRRDGPHGRRQHAGSGSRRLRQDHARHRGLPSPALVERFRTACSGPRSARRRIGWREILSSISHSWLPTDRRRCRRGADWPRLANVLKGRRCLWSWTMYGVRTISRIPATRRPAPAGHVTGPRSCRTGFQADPWSRS